MSGHIYHLTFVTLQREPIFSDPDAANAAARCLHAGGSPGEWDLLAWVLMPDHAHLLCQLGRHGELAVLVRRLKSHAARDANAAIGREGPVWQRGFHDRALRSEDDVTQVGRYIVANPVRAGLVERVELYPWWNAVWLQAR